MNAPPRIVLVASGSSADRAIALERLLAAAASRSGWSDRVEIRLGGIDGGAGRASDAGLAALRAHGIDATGAICPDLARRRSLVEDVAIVVCDRGDIADVLVDWDEAGEATFVVVSELLDAPDEGGDEDDDTPIGEDVRRYEGVIDEVLRRIVAVQPGD